MLKRFGACVLTALYLVTVVGFALNFHYCFYHVTAVNVNSPVNTCSMLTSGKMKCCQTKHIEIKVKDAHRNVASSLILKLIGENVPARAFKDYLQPDYSVAAKNVTGKDPPGFYADNKTAFIKNRIFRI